MMHGPAVLIRADASAAIGMGHAMRCLALADAYATSAGGAATFLMAAAPPAFVRRARASGAPTLLLAAAPGGAADAVETLAVARRVGATWTVLDGYQFDGCFQATLVAGGQRVLALDDHGHARTYHADLVLNQNAGADAALYRDRDPRTRLLLGPRFALLREEFRSWPATRPAVPTRARRVVISLGGSDPDNVSARALEALAAVPGPLEILLLIGAANPHREALQDAAAACRQPVDVALDAHDMARRLAWADIALAAFGGTSWELARVGTPQVGVVLADNQRYGGAALASAGLAVNLGWHADVTAASIAEAVTALAEDRERRAQLSRRGRALVDGRGALRALAAMQLLPEAVVAA